MTQNLFGRDATPEERGSSDEDSFDRVKFVDTALSNRERTNGITRFVSNLFLLSNLSADLELDDEELLDDATLVAHLRQEPIELILRNLDKPWPWFFTTRDILCTTETARLYDYPLFDANGFVSCELPPERAGLLGLASVLRAVPSSFVSVNNNYKRVAFAMYLAQGFKLLSATNGPEGSGPGHALPACVPTTDLRVDPEGLAFGTARVPSEGAVCAACHSRYNGPISVAFRRFKEDGSVFSFEDIDSLGNDQRNGSTTSELKYLLNETESCWSIDGIAPARSYNGLPGLGRLIAESPTLGHALGIQIPQMMGNLDPDANMSASIEKSYFDRGETLLSAMRGYFLSDSFQCAKRKK